MCNYIKPIFDPRDNTVNMDRLMSLTNCATRKALAEALGTSTRTLKAIEQGKASRTLALACQGLVQARERTIEVVARRWFDKNYGNTYFSCAVWLDDEKVCSTDFTYGYGEFYRQWAIEQLFDKGLISTKYETDLRDDYNIKIIANHSDVNRKRDL